MSTPIPQAVLDQVARDAAANAPKNLLNQWVNKIKSMGGRPPAPAPSSSAAQVAKDAKAGAEAMRNYASSQGGANGMGLLKNAGGLTTALTVGGTIGTHMRETMPQSTFVSGRGAGLAATNNARKNSPDPEYSTSPVPSPTNNKPNNASEINARLDQQKKEREAALAVTKGNYDHSSGGYTGQDVAFVPDSTLDTGNGGGNRNNSRVIPGSGGQVQKGTDMSRSFNDLLATTNTSGYQPFGSNQLPTTAGSPDAAVSPKTQQILAGIQAGKETDMSIEGYQEPTSSAKAGVLSGIRGGARTDRGIQGTSTAADGVLAGIQGGQKTDQGIEGYKKPGSTSRLDAALNDTAGINSYMSKFSSGDRERAANRAFLDTEGQYVEALRAKEAVNGVVYAQQQHYVAGETADSPAQKISRAEARDISNGKAKAQDFASRKVAETVAATAQSSDLFFYDEGAKDGAFQQDKPMFPGTTPGQSKRCCGVR